MTKDDIVEAACKMAERAALYHKTGVDMNLKESVNELLQAIEEYVNSNLPVS